MDHMMPFVYNFPAFSILMTLMAGMVTPFVRNHGKVAQKINFAVIVVVGAMNAVLLGTLLSHDGGTSYTYMMGHFPAPWGNELRAGPLEALMATLFCLVMALSILGGLTDIYNDVRPRKLYLYFLMQNLLLSSLLALIYTNDLFTAYVFIEINTIAACAIVMIKDSGETIVATIRYLIMSLLGSGLFLFGVCILYNMTGELLFSSIQEVLVPLFKTGQYAIPLTVVMGLMILGVAIKSAVYPFHSWLPGAHGSSTTSSSAILSGLVLKGYLILLIKMVYRMFTPEMLSTLHVNDVILIFGIAGMMIGSLKALKERHIKRMIAYSSVAQIGYVFMGIGLGSDIGILAACYHILAHAFTKPMLFCAAGNLVNHAGHNYQIKALKGTALKSPLAGIAFTVGSLSMIGIPLFAGFIPKLFFSTGAIESDWFRLTVVLIALAISTVLNALYYIPVCINIWTPKQRKGEHAHGAHDAHEDAHGHGAEADDDDEEELALHEEPHEKPRTSVSFVVSMVLLIACNFALGICYQPLTDILSAGISLLG
ncbi:MAG: proton-conducting transporter membrane subunit [Oscillospiraceae bacterium]|nr:proton-conducting transporter membrane subunit [Oscillospiraceae bacterium]